MQKTLWTWKEAYDKHFYRANLDLGALAGQKVRFVFMLLSSGSAAGDRAIWGSPRIIRSGAGQPPAPPATLTPLPPLTPTTTPLASPPPTLQPAGCDKASFVADVTVQDGAIFAPGAAFTKTWRLKNVGACIWTTAYKLVYYSGEQMSAPTMVNLPWGAAYGQTVDISVNMVAPYAAAKYRGYWILANANGQFFGIGADASKPIWVEINVAGDSPVNYAYYDFVTNACSAEWKNSAGILPCPGTNGDARGFVLTLNPAKLEDGSTNAPGLLAFPQNRYNGYIQGYYPTFTVESGDRFQSAVSCEFGSSCYVTFRLDYLTATGSIGTFWQWREQSDGRYNTVDVDLTPLAGRSVRFILTVLATGSATNDRAVWSSPRIVRTAAPSTANWLTYTNPQYGFQFKYPPQAQILNQS
ncbi:MAG TPA: NBR1-Ig-like domain-containing protein, partial [Gammaproteobacteria bacterium]|nr:NBR1-Ig-like domain-containing protein [Gammaproteobacteria bacterium]